MACCAIGIYKLIVSMRPTGLEMKLIVISSNAAVFKMIPMHPFTTYAYSIIIVSFDVCFHLTSCNGRMHVLMEQYQP